MTQRVVPGDESSDCLSCLSSWFWPQKPFTSNSTAHFWRAHRSVRAGFWWSRRDGDAALTFPTSEGPGCRATEHGRLSGN